jgi:hypothetical protein
LSTLKKLALRGSGPVLAAQRQRVPDGSATAKAIDYGVSRWHPTTRHLDNAALRIDNNWVENQIRPIAVGRVN